MLQLQRLQVPTRKAHSGAAKINFWKNFDPRVKKTVFQPDANKLERLRLKRAKMKAEIVKQGISRFNPLDIEMISLKLHQQVFRNYPARDFDVQHVDACRRNLHKHGMIGKEKTRTEDVDIRLPDFEGGNLEEHFFNIGDEQSRPYKVLVEKLLEEAPSKPKGWVFREGWTRYTPNGRPEKVDFPLEEELVFDVEVCMADGKAPTLATAVSSKAWYGWVSRALIDGDSKPVTDHFYHEDVLIPLESKRTDDGNVMTEGLLKPKIVIGHNVSFDRTKIKEQYWLNRTGTRFLDTMSLHVSVSGMTSYQRAVLKSKKLDPDDEAWTSLSSLNGLSEVHKLYCGSEIAKETRNIFVVGNIVDIQKEFQTVMDYCSEDVNATLRVFKKLYPMYIERFPHPVSFAGMLELGTGYLPVNDNWVKYLEDAELTYDELDVEGKVLLGKRAEQACQLLHKGRYKEDLWMWDQDWTVQNLSLKKVVKKKRKAIVPVVKNVLPEDAEELDPLEIKFRHFKDLEVKPVFLSGYPLWYKKLCIRTGFPEWTPGPHYISTSMQITPKLLNLTWEGYPLHYIRGLGWGLLVPFPSDVEDTQIPVKKLLEKCPAVNASKDSSEPFALNIANEVQENLARKEYYSRLKKDKTEGVYKGSGIWCNTIIEDCVFFFKLPHKDGASFRVGNPLAKDFLNKFSENVLAGDTESAEQVLSIARKLSYWRNNRDRIRQQMVVWLNKENVPADFPHGNYGAILPVVVVCGTLTRRAVEPTWMTASNAHKERIGSELRAMIQAPPGYKIVGADVDSQELWIASVIGDASSAGLHGCTPFGWMTLSGNKSDGTDMHSVTAQAIGISRDHAKVINYARIYGAGQNFAERLLKQFNPTMSESESRSKAQKMFALTKGKRLYQLRPEHVHDLADVPYNKWNAFELSKLHGKPLNEMFHNPKWIDGTESAMFNRLEEIASDPSPTTPFLNSRLTRALEPCNLPDDKFLPTRVNWVVQSGAVDFLHLMLVCMRWLLKDKARFCLSFHDEVRYLVKDEHKYEAALAMHITNLLTRAFCSVKLGMYDLPKSVAFFSSVEIDQVLRKEAKLDCKTPSNPHGLEKGYGIPNGESLNIHDAIRKTRYKCHEPQSVST